MKKINQKSIIIITLVLLVIQIICEVNRVTIFSNLIKPVMWLLFCVYLIFVRHNSYFRFSEEKKNVTRIIIITIFYYVIWFYFGIIFGFVRSPYGRSIFSILKNLFRTCIPIIGIEFVRNIVINSNKDRAKYISVIITIILILVEIQYGYMLDNFSKDRESIFKYIVQDLIPLIASSVLYSYLANLGSERVILIFRLPDRLLYYILPIIPDINWFLKACIGIIVPIIIWCLFYYVFPRHNRNVRTFRRKNKIGISIALVLSILLVSFMLGLFKYEPVVIVSNSMVPKYSRGDIVVYEKMSDVDLKNLKENSIIIYRIDDQMIAHRVVNVIQDNTSVKFETKGDANNGSDTKLVSIDQVVGVYKFHIKYIGYPSVWLNDFFNDEEAKVETK